MKKKIVPFLLILSLALNACKKEAEENKDPNPNPGGGGSSLLQNSITGNPFTTGTINDFTLAYNNNSVVLLAANNTTGKIYAIDLKDNDASTASANAWTGTVNDIAPRLANQMGLQINDLRFYNMDVNPITNAVYIMVSNAQGAQRTIFKITGGGTTIAPVSLDNVSYSAITFSTSGEAVADLAWGDNKMYVSLYAPSTLNGQIGSVQAPFQHNASTSSRATTVFKSNWGDNYFTNAPLEVLAYGEIDGKKRLMGVTVCAPGFSFETSDISQGNGLLQVQEYFNLNGTSALKAFAMGNYLVELHDNGRLTRIGKKYINGTSADVNANAPQLLDFQGNVSPGYTDEDVKVVRPMNSCFLATKYSNTQVLIMNYQGVFSLITI